MNDMLQTLTRQWYVLTSTAPGERFQKILEARANARGLEYQGRRNVCLATGGVMVSAGLALPLQVVSLALVLAGLVLLARESWAVAALLDLADMRRQAWKGRFSVNWSRQGGSHSFALAVSVASFLAVWAVTLCIALSR